MLKKAPPPVMDPLEAGERVLAGVRNNDLYITSHAELETSIRERNEALLASVPRDKNPPPAARVQIERQWDMLRNPICSSEREHRLCEQRVSAT